MRLRVGGRWTDAGRPPADAALTTVAPVHQVCPLPGGDLLLALGNPNGDGVLRLERRTADGQTRWGRGELFHAACAGDGSAIVASAPDGVELLDPASGHRVGRPPVAHPYVIPTGASHLLGRHPTRDRRLASWPLTGAAEPRVVALVDVGWLVAAGERAIVGSGRELFRVRLDQGSALTLPRPAVPRSFRHVALSPDGRWLAYAGRLAIAVVDLDSGGTTRWATHQHGLGTPTGLAWHPDGLLAAADERGTVGLYTPRLKPQTLTRTFASGLPRIDALAFDADARALWVAGGTMALRWPLLPDEAYDCADELATLDDRDDAAAASVLDDLLRERGWR